MTSSNTINLFGKTAELKAALDQIRAMEASSPGIAKFTAPKIPKGDFCNKRDLLAAEAHLAKLQGKAPTRAPRPTAKAPKAAEPKATATAKTPTGRTAAELLALSSADQQAICRRACNTREIALRTEIIAAFQSMPASAERSKFYQTFKTAIKH